MKKLVYIVLIVAVLVLVGKYVKEKKQEKEMTPEPVTIVSEESYSYDIVDPITGEVVGTNEGNIVETTFYNDENGDGMIVEDEFVEENPEITSDDDETIIAE